MKERTDINCDLGEGYGTYRVSNDEEIMRHITSANIACGFHAGDPMTIAQTICLAKKHNVAVGAHPGYPDLMGFGRREMKLTLEEARNYVAYQVGALQGLADAANANVQHVKTHGALYNLAVKDAKLSKAIVEAVNALDQNLIIFAPPKSILADVSAKTGLRVAHEFFADRAYNPDGSLVSRSEPDAIIKEPRKALERTIKVIKEGTVLAANGKIVNLGKVHTICVHGDTPNALKLAETLKRGLTRAGIDVRPVGSFL